MTLPAYWKPEYRALYDRTFQVLLTAGCDARQADSIAKERVVQKVLHQADAHQEFRAMQERRKGTIEILPPQ